MEQELLTFDQYVKATENGVEYDHHGELKIFDDDIPRETGTQYDENDFKDKKGEKKDIAMMFEVDSYNSGDFKSE